jgi:hypothetical protein
VPEKCPPTAQILEQPTSECIPPSQRLIGSLVAACTLHTGQSACSGKIYNMIMLAWPSHILISNNALLVIGKITKSLVSDDLKVSLLSDYPLLTLPFKLLKACFHYQKASWICVPRPTMIIYLLPDISDLRVVGRR